MNVDSFLSLRSLKTHELWLLGLASLLFAVLLTLAWRVDEVDHLGMLILFVMAIASMIQDRKAPLMLNSSGVGIVVGSLCILWVLIYSLSTPEKFHTFIRVAPFVSGVGLTLLAAGFQGIKQFAKELTILFFLGIPRVLVSMLVDISPVTAKFSAFMLWYVGFDVTRDGVYIRLPTGAVEVYEGCSGLESMSYLLGLSVIFLMMFPLSRLKQIIVPIVAIATGFVVNGVRVSLMAVLAASGNKASFDYWHEGDGSMIFAISAVLLFGAFCFFMSRQSDNQPTPTSL